jgi:hypothetical protein
MNPSYNWPSGRPITNKPSNKYAYSRKERQQRAIDRALSQAQETKTPCLLDLSIKELTKLLKSQNPGIPILP